MKISEKNIHNDEKETNYEVFTGLNRKRLYVFKS